MSSQIRFKELKKIRSIPIDIFSFKLLSPSEILVYYLTHKKHLKQTEIAFLLKKNPRTIWTVLTRAEEKIKNMKVPVRFDYAERKQNTRIQVRQMA